MKQLHVKQTYKLVFLKMLVDLISCSNAVWGSAGKKKQHIKYVCLRQRWLRKFTCNLVTVNLRTVNYTSPKPHYISIAYECFFYLNAWQSVSLTYVRVFLNTIIVHFHFIQVLVQSCYSKVTLKSVNSQTQLYKDKKAGFPKSLPLIKETGCLWAYSSQHGFTVYWGFKRTWCRCDHLKNAYLTIS